MKKYYVLSALLAIFLSGVFMIQLCIQTGKKQRGDLLFENVEALTQNESDAFLHCSKPLLTANCYRKVKRETSTGTITVSEWVALRIVEIQEYTVPVGAPILCEHAKITDCPSGSY